MAGIHPPTQPNHAESAARATHQGLARRLRLTRLVQMKHRPTDTGLHRPIETSCGLFYSSTQIPAGNAGEQRVGITPLQVGQNDNPEVIFGEDRKTRTSAAHMPGLRMIALRIEHHSQSIAAPW